MGYFIATLLAQAAALQAARPLEPGELRGNTSEATLFKVNVPAKSVLTVRLRPESDLDLYVTNDKLEVLGSSQRPGTLEEEVLNLPFADASAAYVVLRGPATSARFTLRVELPKPDPDRDCFERCDVIERMEGSTRFLAVPKGQGHFIVAPLKYAYARRDLIGLLRYATRSVLERFPDQARDPVAIAEMSQADGKTPGSDSLEPHHVEGSHEAGRDVDLGYYVKDGVSNWRIVCGKGTDRNENGVPGRYNDGSFCTTDENVVDLRRQVWFLAKLAESSRYRVVGVDVTIDPQIEAEARSLYERGEIGISQLWRLTQLVRSGAEGSWQFHHHHLHFSTVGEHEPVVLSLP